MKRLVLFLLVLLAATSCGGYGSKSQALEEYDQIFAQVQELESLLRTADFAEMSAESLVSTYESAKELYYDFNPMGLEANQIVACEALKSRVLAIRDELVAKCETHIASLRISSYKTEDTLLEKTESYPVYLKKGERLYWSVAAEKPIDVKLCNADAKTVVKAYNGKSRVIDSLVVPNTAIYFLEVNPRGTQYLDIDLSYKVNELARATEPTTIHAEQVECSKGDFGAIAVPGLETQRCFEEPRKFTLRGQLKAAFSGNSKALVAVKVPTGATDILYSMRIATSEKDRADDGEFHDNITRSYTRIKVLGLPLYEKTKSNGLLNTILDDNRPIRDEDAYCNMYVFRNQAQAKAFQDGTKLSSQLNYDVDYSTVGTQSCNGRIPTNGVKTIYLGFENERMRYTNYLWVEVEAVVPKTVYYRTKYSID